MTKAGRFVCDACGAPLRKCVNSRQQGSSRVRDYRCGECGHTQSTVETKRWSDRAAGSDALTLEGVLSLVSDEVRRATAKFPTWPSDPIHAKEVLGEEFGELAKEVLQMVYEPHKTSREKIRTEALQCAAMAVRFLMSLDRYVYAPSEQHSQHREDPQ